MPTPDFIVDGTQRQRRAYAELQSLLAARSSAPSWYFAVGRHVQVLVPRGDDHRYGRLAALARSLGASTKSFESMLYAARQTYLCFGDRKRHELRGLGWSHLRLLATVPDDNDREEMLTSCLRAKWSVKELLLRIQSRYGKRSNAGRRLASREDYEPAVLLRETVRMTNHWLIHYPAWFGDSPESLARLPRTRVNAELRGDIELARHRLKELAQCLEAAEKILRRLGETKPRAASAKKKPGGR